MSDNPIFWTKQGVIDTSGGLVEITRNAQGEITSRAVDNDNPNVSTLFSTAPSVDKPTPAGLLNNAELESSIMAVTASMFVDGETEEF